MADEPNTLLGHSDNGGIVLHCPNCAHEFRRRYVPVAALKDARTTMDRALGLLETASSHSRILEARDVLREALHHA